MTLFENNLLEHNETFARLQSVEASVNMAIEQITVAISQGGKLLLCGNGGSAADSQHIAAEFTGRFIKDRRPLPALALSTDTSALTCIGNDYSFADVFSRQVLALGKPGDVLFGISTSGNSSNVMQAVTAAKSIGIHCIGLLGRDGGSLREVCDISIIVESNTTARIQEAHIFIGHTICGAVEQALGLV